MQTTDPRNIILNTNGKIFGATVVKRNGEIREFNARTFEDTDNERDRAYNMLTVLEQNATIQGKGRYRTIALEGVKEIRFAGRTIAFDQL